MKEHARSTQSREQEVGMTKTWGRGDIVVAPAGNDIDRPHWQSRGINNLTRARDYWKFEQEVTGRSSIYHAYDVARTVVASDKTEERIQVDSRLKV